MNVKRQEYKKNRLAGMSCYKAAIAAGYRHGYAWNAATRLEKACNIKELLAKHGLDDETLCEGLKEGLKADKVISCNVIAPNGEGMSDAHGTTKDFIEVPDHATRHKYIETLKDLLGYNKKDSQTIGIAVKIGDIVIEGSKQEYRIG